MTPPPSGPRDAASPTTVGGARAWSVLDGGHGRVLAVFRRGTYLAGSGGLCFLTSADLPCGPLNIHLDPITASVAGLDRLRPGASWRLCDERLVIGPGIDIGLATRRVWRAPRARRQPAAEGQRALALLDQGIRALAHRPLPSDAARRLPGELHVRLDAGSRALAGWLATAPGARARTGARGEAVRLLLGCGPGLTPSGDDVLIGALVTLHGLGPAAAARELARDVARRAPGATGLVSAAHLLAAAEGESIAPLHDLILAVSEGRADAMTSALSALDGHGQSSGRDCLRGVRIVLEGLALR